MIIDLTKSYESDMPGVSIRPAKSLEKDGWNASTLELYSHAGTHMDAPYHFGVSNQRIDQIPPEKFMGKAWLVRLNNISAQQEIKVADLGQIRQKFQAGDSLLLASGWSKHIGTSTFRDELPRISEELAQWCVDNKVKMLGVEPPSVANVNELEELTLIHQVLLGGGVIIIEGLINLEKISQETVHLIALPLKIKNGDGAPARVIAIEE
ncbi:cyclase family protein [Porifericola rhodea]|uniref:cyclase family protein n=1 Tax=Porifericola rhodea TaxID=930972 RepID=UPI0026667D3E|nr:cyclase family protein [Porifericola rhodea]WKN30864.1 cyclase family protein [Porifericola rhodea]